MDASKERPADILSPKCTLAGFVLSFADDDELDDDEADDER